MSHSPSDPGRLVLLGTAVLLAIGAAGCDPDACIRNTDCAHGEQCRQGLCTGGSPSQTMDATTPWNAADDAGGLASDADSPDAWMDQVVEPSFVEQPKPYPDDAAMDSGTGSVMEDDAAMDGDAAMTTNDAGNGLNEDAGS